MTRDPGLPVRPRAGLVHLARAAALVAALACPVAGALAAQDTTRVADTLGAADTLQTADSVPVLDSLALPPAGTDTVPDSLVVHRMEPLTGTRPAADPARVAFWGREQLLRTRALTLTELLATLPGAVPVRTGDYGSPAGMVFNGRAGGRLRIFIDGSEEPALDGSVPDLAQVSLGGLESVEVVRSGGETRIFLVTRQAEVPDPESTIEAGTGDLETNVFRGSFIHPRAFGGSLGLVFERLDSEGRGENGAGSLQNLWLRYLRPLGDRVTVSGEIRSRGVESALPRTPSSLTRTSRTARVRARLFEGVALDLYATENRLDLTEDSTVADVARNQHYGVRLGWSAGPSWGRAAFRYRNPAGRPTIQQVDVDGGFSRASLGGVSGRLGWERVEGEQRWAWGVSAWTRPLLGISLYGSLDQGVRGWQLPAPPGLGTVPDSLAALYPDQSDARYLRAGARVELGPLRVDAAALRTESDAILPLGNRVDRGIRPFPGEDATGFEVSGSLGLPVSGFALEGSLQQWDEAGIYRPERIYRGGLTFHDTFFPTGNLELTGSVLAEGRSPMEIPVLDPGTGFPQRVPFYQSWNAYLQIRVVTVRIFVRWDNLFIRQNNQDIPGLLLPRTRAMYGVRWTLLN